jgi:DNA-binding NarL/FixJ family response regulator
MKGSIKLLIAEDHEVVSTGYIDFLKDSADFEILGVVNTVQELYYKLSYLKIDVLLLDLFLPRINVSDYSKLVGYEILEFIKNNNIDVKVIVHSVHEEPAYIVKARGLGALGYLNKKMDKKELREAVRRVGWEKKEYIQQNLLSKMIASDNPDGIILTQREKSILFHISEGLTSRQIADKLNLANDTIRDYRDGLIRKFGAKNSVNLIKIAAENGYLIHI